jgi:hypothetical protein
MVAYATAPPLLPPDDAAIEQMEGRGNEMATHAGTTHAKPGIGKSVWLAVAAFVVAAIVVIALVAMLGGSTTPAHPVPVGTATVISGVENPGGNLGRSGQTGIHGSQPGGDQSVSGLIPLGNGVCPQCAP